MKTGQKGFTLTELMIVVAILGIMAAVAIPSLGSMMSGYGVKSAARDVCSALRTARSMAIKENRVVAVAFIPGADGTLRNGHYVLDANGPKHRAMPDCDEGSLGRRYGGGVHFGFGSAGKSAANTPGKLPAAPVTFSGKKVAFNPRGLSNAGYVYLADGDGGACAVGVRSSGSIILKQWTGEKWK